MNKFMALISVLIILLFSFPVFSLAAAPDIYSNLPEPYPNDSTRYFAILLGSAPSLYQISAQGGIKDVVITLVSDIVTINVITEIASAQPQATVFNLFNGDLRQNSFNFGSRQGDSAVYTYKFSNFNVTTKTVKLSGYGCVFGAGWSVEPYNVAWNDSTDPSTYTTLLNNINSKLNEIDTNTDGIEGSLSSIQSELDLFYNLFNAYQSSILEDTTNIQLLLETVIVRLQSFSDQNHIDLVNILNKLNDIYHLLNEEASTYAPADPDNKVDSYIEAESDLMKDYSGDLEIQLGSGDAVFNDNSSFGFISSLFNSLILSNNSINALLLFSLCIGLGILILGRRLNA